MSNIYNKELNEFCRKFIVRGEYNITQQDVLLYKNRLDNLKALIFENLMLFDKTTFKVYGENVPLAVLVNELSVVGLEEIIEQGGINFALWTPMIGYMQSNVDGLIPLVTGRVNSDVHCDPEKSIDVGLKFLTKKPNKKQRETLRRKVRDLYVVPKEGLENDSKDFTLSAYNSNKLKPFGLDKDLTDIYNLNMAQKKVLSGCAEELLEYKFVLSGNMVFSNNQRFHSLFTDTAQKILKSKHEDVVAHIAHMENFPNLKEVSFSLDKPLRNIHKLRGKRNVKKFRSWLDQVTDNHEMEEVSRAYIDAISNSKGFFETKKGRFTKNIAMTLLGAGVGSLAGPAGIAIGGTVGKVLEPVADFVLDLVDEYLITELVKGWTPRMFFDEFKSISDKK